MRSFAARVLAAAEESHICRRDGRSPAGPDREVTSWQQRLRELRRMLVHEYPTATAEEVCESARIVSPMSFRSSITPTRSGSNTGSNQGTYES